MMVHDASWFDAAGRMLVVAYFLVAGLTNVTPGQIRHHIGRLTGFHVPFPVFAFWTGMAVQFTGCALLVTGWHADLGVYALIAFSLAANGIYNRFWTVQDPVRRDFGRLLFLANIGVLGGLLLVLGNLP